MKVVPRENTGCIHDAERETVESELRESRARHILLSERQQFESGFASLLSNLS